MKRSMVAAAALLASFVLPHDAHAVPAFARQTGQNCNACHVSFPELTPYGRWFKLTGYTIGRRTLPLAMMAEVSRTSTKNNTDPATGFDVTPENNEVVLQDISVFLAGKATDHVGGFVQWTYDHQASLEQDATSGQWTRHGHAALDNTDLRAVGLYTAPQSKEPDLVYGVTVNNNPTVQDVWNTTPTWSFPFTGSSTTQFGPPGTLLEGGAAATAGMGGYVFWKKSLYAELSAYRTADGAFSILRAGTPAADRVVLKGYNPYWRLAYNKEWGEHSFELGTFGLVADVFPDNTDPTGPTDRFNDTGVDAQYQYIGDPHAVTAQVSYIHEKQSWDASFAGGGTDNPSDTLNSAKAKVTYYYRRKYGATLGYFSVTGSLDTTFWTGQAGVSGKPDTTGYIFELDYVPIDNLRLMLQYVAYRKFFGLSDNYDGNGRNASDNNTLFLNAWVAF
jgi:hypothetical protein